MDPQAAQRKPYIYLLVIALAAGVYVLNQHEQEVRRRERAEREQLRQQRDLEQAQAKLEAEGRMPKSCFDLPPDAGPPDAPVRIVAYINSSNECLKATAEILRRVPNVYGDLVRLDFRDLVDREILGEADARHLGCDAGIYFNGEISRKAQPGNLAGIRTFLGVVDSDHYAEPDIYGAINYLLEEQGLQVPPKARRLAQPRR